MTALHTLIRLRRRTLDAARQELSVRENKRIGIEYALNQIQEDLRTEQNIAQTSAEMAPFFSGFAQGAHHRRELLHQALELVHEEIREASEAVHVAFAEVKKFEIALATRERRARAEADRKERISLDELAIDRHRRRRMVN